MAKLSARGRTEIYRVTKSYQVRPDEDVTLRKKTVCLMSDGNVLEKITVRFKPMGSWDDPKGRLHDWGYKVKGKIASGHSNEEWLAKHLAAGFVKE
jgi:hypothetical protein